jgi:predicted membrane-bound spermidine synthase
MRGKSRSGRVDRKKIVRKLAEMLESTATEEQFEAVRLMVLADAANFLERAVRHFDQILADLNEGRKPSSAKT